MNIPYGEFLIRYEFNPNAFKDIPIFFWVDAEQQAYYRISTMPNIDREVFIKIQPISSNKVLATFHHILEVRLRVDFVSELYEFEDGDTIIETNLITTPYPRQLHKLTNNINFIYQSSFTIEQIAGLFEAVELEPHIIRIKIPLCYHETF